MKKQILIAALLLTGKAFSQEFNQGNEASVGSSVSMYICDSLTSNFATTKGSNVTWDFSSLVIPDTTKKSLISVIDPSTTKYKSLYTNANKAIVFENFITSYYSSSKSERNCLGYFFGTKDYGDVRAVFSSDPEVTHTYPFKLNSSKTDVLKGKLYYKVTSPIVTDMTADAVGSSKAEVDALGTLKIDAGHIYKNILRYHLKDSTSGSVVLFGNQVDATVVLDQYEYYDHASSNLPIYTHSNLKAYISLSTDPIVNKTFVLSKYKVDKNAKPVEDTTTTNPTTSLEDLNKSALILYPNPAKNVLYVIGNNTNNGSILVLDQTGKTVKSFKQTNELDIQSLEKGIYFVKVEGVNSEEILKFVKD